MFCYFQNHHLTVAVYEYRSDKLKADFEDYSIVQLSDLHNAEFGRDNRKLLEKIMKLDPDMIVFTGDIVDSDHTDIDVSLKLAEELALHCPVYYVTGNHEYRLSADERSVLLSGLSEAGVTVLDNTSVKINRGDGFFNLIGLDDNSLYDDTLEDIISSSDKALNVVLAHEPQYLSNYEKAGADLVFAGHAHGGQIVIPFVGPVFAPGQGLWPDHTDGEYFSGDTEMIVSRGLGNSVFPLRIFNYPQIVCVKLSSDRRF